jgi:hypothetical protein
MTPTTTYLKAMTVWPCRLLGLSLMIVAISEVAQFGLCYLEERRRG